MTNDKAICAEACIFCGSHDHCDESHPFKDINDLIKSIPIGLHIPCGISESNSDKIRQNIKKAFNAYTRKIYEDTHK